jgi:Phosphotransferase enzyme family
MYQIPTKTWAVRRATGVLLAGAGERLRARPSQSGSAIPRSPGEVSAEWLTAVLCSETAGARVISVARGAHSSGTTTRQALEVTYNDHGATAGLPTSLFVKCTTTLAQRVMLGLGGLIDGEPGFYAHIRPRLHIEAPAGYFAAVDPRSWRSIVVLEDVERTRGARFWQPSSTIERVEIEDLLTTMAAWHGALWDSPRLPQWRWLKTPAEQMAVIDALIPLADRTRAGAQRGRDAIPPAVRRRQRELHPALRSSMRLLSEGPATYLHGDLHIANTYSIWSGAIGICDWQVGLRGGWAHDYSYLLATALEVEDRREWEGELLDFYLERLAASGGPSLPREAAWKAYRQATLYPYFAWLYTLGRSRLQPSFQPAATSVKMVERIAAAIEDLDSFGAVGV